MLIRMSADNDIMVEVVEEVSVQTVPREIELIDNEIMVENEVEIGIAPMLDDEVEVDELEVLDVLQVL